MGIGEQFEFEKTGRIIEERTMPNCYFCNREVGEDDFCFGCQQYICDKCDDSEQAGDHEPEDHLG